MSPAAHPAVTSSRVHSTKDDFNSVAKLDRSGNRFERHASSQRDHTHCGVGPDVLRGGHSDRRSFVTWEPTRNHRRHWYSGAWTNEVPSKGFSCFLPVFLTGPHPPRLTK